LGLGLYKRFHLTNNVSIQCTISSEFFKPLWLYSSIILYTLCWMISWWMGVGGGGRSEMSANSTTTNVAPTCHKSVAILMSLGNWTHAISVGAIIVFVG
jgi:hypothetical protein